MLPKDTRQSPEISLVDVLQFIVRHKKALLIGGIIGSISVLLYTQLSAKRYVSRILVNIDAATYMNSTNREDFVLKFNNAFLEPQVAIATVEAIIKSGGTFKEKLAKNSWTETDLLAAQMSKEDRILKIDTTGSSLTYVAELSLPARGLENSVGQLIIDSLNAAATENNNMILAVYEQSSSFRSNQAASKFKDIESAYRTDKAKRQDQINFIKIRMAQLEHDILQKLKGSAALSREMALPPRVTVSSSVNNTVSREMETLEKDFHTEDLVKDIFSSLNNEEVEAGASRVIRLLGIAKSERVLNEVDINKMSKMVSEMLSENTSSSIAFANSDFLIRSTLQKYLEADQKQRRSVEKDLAFLPKFSLNQKYYDTVMAGKQLEHKKAVEPIRALVFGFALGVLAAAIVALSIQFYKNYKYQLKSS